MSSNKITTHVERDAETGLVVIKFLRETPEWIKKIYQGLNVEPTITHECPLAAELSDEEIKKLVESLKKV